MRPSRGPSGRLVWGPQGSPQPSLRSAEGRGGLTGEGAPCQPAGAPAALQGKEGGPPCFIRPPEARACPGAEGPAEHRRGEGGSGSGLLLQRRRRLESELDNLRRKRATHNSSSVSGYSFSSRRCEKRWLSHAATIDQQTLFPSLSVRPGGAFDLREAVDREHQQYGHLLSAERGGEMDKGGPSLAAAINGELFHLRETAPAASSSSAPARRLQGIVSVGPPEGASGFDPQNMWEAFKGAPQDYLLFLWFLLNICLAGCFCSWLCTQRSYQKAVIVSP
ncbi:hypothetical protein Efla_000967 [Eimeria flavescens]